MTSPRHRSFTGEIALLFEEDDRYRGRLLLITLDTEVPLELNTFEVEGDLAVALSPVLEEGQVVRIDCRGETQEVVSPESLETSDKTVARVLHVEVLEQASDGPIHRADLGVVGRHVLGKPWSGRVLCLVRVVGIVVVDPQKPRGSRGFEPAQSRVGGLARRSLQLLPP